MVSAALQSGPSPLAKARTGGPRGGTGVVATPPLHRCHHMHLDQAAAHGRTPVSNDEAEWEKRRSIEVSALAPQVSWGASPEQALPIDGRVPDLRGAAAVVRGR